ncbi:MAG: Cytochrome c-552 [Firmicutes bacterium]|nr:Cytochrome c-552 [Bacillota bacterium]
MSFLVVKNYRQLVLRVGLYLLAAAGLYFLGFHLPNQARAPAAPPPAPMTEADPRFWQERFPDQTASYLRTSEMEPTVAGGSVPYQKLTKYPFMRTMYHGFGFWFDFRESRGHMFSAEDTLISGRGKIGGVCWACKSADYPALVARYGQREFDTMFWSEAARKATHPVSCIDCHDPASPTFALRLTRPWLEEAIVAQGRQIGDFDMRSLTCAQCHSEYYFRGAGTENKVIFPWSKGFRADDALAQYDAIKFSDWVHPRTDAGVLKVQHPEFEFFQGSVHARQGLTCADCHMPRVTNAAGRQYTQHWLTSPLKHMEASCQRCHSDLAATRRQVETIQTDLRTQANQVGTELATAIDALRDVRRNPAADRTIVAEAQKLHREAQFLLDWFLVENSTGFHNAAEGRRVIEAAQQLTTRMMETTRRVVR